MYCIPVASSQAEADGHFLRYCERHATEDGPGAEFTWYQIDKLEVLADTPGAIFRGTAKVDGLVTPRSQDIVAAVNTARERAVRNTASAK